MTEARQPTAAALDLNHLCISYSLCCRAQAPLLSRFDFACSQTFLIPTFLTEIFHTQDNDWLSDLRGYASGPDSSKSPQRGKFHHTLSPKNTLSIFVFEEQVTKARYTLSFVPDVYETTSSSSHMVLPRNKMTVMHVILCVFRNSQSQSLHEAD